MNGEPERKGGRRLSRREFLGVAKGAAVSGVIAAGIVGGIGGYVAGSGSKVTVTETVARTVPGQTLTVTQTLAGEARPIKAGYIYPGPAADLGWSYAHDNGRKKADEIFGKVESTYIEFVEDAKAASAINNLLAQDVDLIITCSFGYMDATAEAAEKNPDKYFVHISGYRSGAAGNAPQNMSTAFAEFYQLYYLNGLAAGAVTKTGVVGYVAAFPIPEVVRHINAFVLGANVAYKKRTGREIKAYVNWLFTWVSPDKARAAAQALIEDANADVLAFTEDTPATLQLAEEYTTKKGRQVWSFSHYSDMTSYGPNSHLTGQVVDWSPIYLQFYRLVATKTWESVDIWTRIGDMMPWRWRRPVERSTAGKPEGTVYLAPLNPVISSEWQLEIKRRYEEMKELLFEPFSPEGNLGQPIRDQDGNVRIGPGERADREMLWNMDWFVEYIESPLPK